jgi:predicted nucleic acid-binding protein
MKALYDTNVLLDVLAKRDPFYKTSAMAWSLSERGVVQGVVSAISFSNIYYIAAKAMGHRSAMAALKTLRRDFTPVAVDTAILDRAIESRWKDFEDAIQYECAMHAKAKLLVTRNSKDFKRSEIAVVTPQEMLELM